MGYCVKLFLSPRFCREADALIKLKKAYGLSLMFIISRDEERTLTYMGEEIAVIPVWKWLL